MAPSIGKSSPELRLISLIHALSESEASNRLMRRSDRELGICMLYMDRSNCDYIAPLLGEKKLARVLQERDYVSGLGLRYPDYRIAVENVIAALEGRKQPLLKSYVRPR